MTKSKWKPLYEYKVPFLTQVGLLLGWVVIIALIGGEAVLIINEMRLTLVLSCMLGAVLFVLALILLYVLYRHSSSAVRRRMQKYGIETFCKQKGLVLARSASQKMGLFTSAGKVVVEPEYRNIVFMLHFYLLEDERGLWGAYNASLSRIVIGCEYETINVDNNKNVIVEKEGLRYTFSPYGSLVHKVNAKADGLANQFMGKL